MMQTYGSIEEIVREVKHDFKDFEKMNVDLNYDYNESKEIIEAIKKELGNKHTYYTAVANDGMFYLMIKRGQ